MSECEAETRCLNLISDTPLKYQRIIPQIKYLNIHYYSFGMCSLLQNKTFIRCTAIQPAQLFDQTYFKFNRNKNLQVHTNIEWKIYQNLHNLVDNKYS